MSSFSVLSVQIPKGLPSVCFIPSLPISSKHKSSHSTPISNQLQVRATRIVEKPSDYLHLNRPCLALQVGALLATIGEPAYAVTGVNNEEDLTWVLIQLGIIAFWYFLIMPPIIMNWLRIRWYRRNLLEMYFQFMFVFLFFPGILVWAPFLNFRRFPRDPSMKYPWSTPQNPSAIRNTYLKYPFAKPEDYE